MEGDQSTGYGAQIRMRT